MDNQIYQQNEWVDVEGTSSTPPSPRGRRGLRALVFALLVLLGILLITAFIWGLFIGRDGSSQQSAMDEEIRLAIAACNREQNSEECLENLAIMLAQKNGNSAICEAVETDNPDECYYIAALESKNHDDCRKIKNHEKQAACEDALVLIGNDFEDCEELQDPQKKQQCEDEWRYTTWLSGDCSSEHIPDEMCAEITVLQQAIKEKNPDYCDSIIDEFTKDACIELVGSGDRDFDGVPGAEEEFRGTSDFDEDSDDDGLTDFEEIYNYGTDPTLPDTDGDGYGDELEVKGGFNPLQ